MTNREAMERFALAQGMYSQLGEIVSTRNVESLRHEVDEAVLNNWRETGATSYPLTIGGDQVGAMNVTTKTDYVVHDNAKFEKWQIERGYAVPYADIDPDFSMYQWMCEDPDYDAKLAWLRENIPGFLCENLRYRGEWREGLTHAADAVFDVETGEELPFLTYETYPIGTKVSGCKWVDGPKKYVDVRDTALVKLHSMGSPIAALLEGGGE